MEPIKKLCDEVRTINEYDFCYLGDILNADGGCEVAEIGPLQLGVT